jgi:hypothetical protein
MPLLLSAISSRHYKRPPSTVPTGGLALRASPSGTSVQAVRFLAFASLEDATSGECLLFFSAIAWVLRNALSSFHLRSCTKRVRGQRARITRQAGNVGTHSGLRRGDQKVPVASPTAELGKQHTEVMRVAEKNQKVRSR